MLSVIFNKKTFLIALALCTIHISYGQSDEVEYQDEPSTISEDTDDRIRRQQEEADRNNNNYNSVSASGGAANEDGANPPDPEGDPGAPIDGGLSVLLAAGAAYGVKRMAKKKVDNPQSTDDSK